MKTVPQKGAEDTKELAPALTHSYWLNSLDYFGSRPSAVFLYLWSHSYPAKPTVAKFSKLNSSLFSESYLPLLLANHAQATPSRPIYTITHTHLLNSAPYYVTNNHVTLLRQWRWQTTEAEIRNDASRSLARPIAQKNHCNLKLASIVVLSRKRGLLLSVFKTQLQHKMVIVRIYAQPLRSQSADDTMCYTHLT